MPLTAPTNVFIAFVIGVLAAIGWAQLSREVRSKTLALARVDYVRAAEAVGSSNFRIITRHILPNVLSHIIVAVSLAGYSLSRMDLRAKSGILYAVLLLQTMPLSATMVPIYGLARALQGKAVAAFALTEIMFLCVMHK